MDFIKKHPRVCLSLFLVPLLLHLIAALLADPTKLVKHYVEWQIPVRLCMLIEGSVWGVASGLISLILALALFKLFPKWQHLQKRLVLFSVCWLIPFSLGSLAAGISGSDVQEMTMSAGQTLPYQPLPPGKELLDGVIILLISGPCAGVVGLAVFAGLTPISNGCSKEGA